MWGDAEVAETVTAGVGVIADGDASSGIDTRAAADAGIVAGGVPDRALGAGVSADAHGSATSKRRHKYNHVAQLSKKHCRRMPAFATARGSVPGSDPGPVEGHPAEDYA